VKPVPFWLFYLGPVLTLRFCLVRHQVGRQIPLADELQSRFCCWFAAQLLLAWLADLPPAGHYSAALTAAVYACCCSDAVTLLWRPHGRHAGRF